MITIKASFAECIDRLIYYTSPTIDYTKEIAFDNEDSKEEVIEALSKCSSFTIEDGYLYCTVAQTDEEIQEQKDHANFMVSAQINSLRKWCNLSEENKEQIINYLKYKNLDWVITELKLTS